MSLATRTALSTAANTVTGVNVQPYYVQTTAPGAGMVRLGRSERDPNGFGFMDTWQVFVVLPQSLAAAEMWVDNNSTALINALSPHMVVASVEQRSLVLDGGVVAPVVVIEGHRESE